MSGARKSDLYRDVTARIVEQLEQGRVPWVQPWRQPGIDTPLGLPKNAATGNLYSGINILLLWGAAIEQGRCAQSWLTLTPPHIGILKRDPNDCPAHDRGTAGERIVPTEDAAEARQIPPPS